MQGLPLPTGVGGWGGRGGGGEGGKGVEKKPSGSKLERATN